MKRKQTKKSAPVPSNKANSKSKPRSKSKSEFSIAPNVPAILKSKKSRDKGGKKNSTPQALLLGIGLDAKDGHTRVTSGPNFHLVGGSKDTHEQMQETALKFNEELSKRGKRLNELSHEEFFELARKARG